MSTPKFPRTQLRLNQLEERLAPANFEVSAIGDDGAGTLRAAIAQANTTAGADTITFSSLFNSAQTISLTTGQLLISDPVTVTGPGASLLTVRRDTAAATNFRIFEVNGTGVINVTISGMTITGGNPTGTGGSGTSGDGGGLLMFNDTVTLDGVAITGNTSGTEGGGIAVASVNSGGAGSLTIRNSTVSGNTATGAIITTFGGSGGGMYFANGGSLLMQNCTLSGNTTVNGHGGGLYFYGNNLNGLSILNSTVSGNTATRNGGGLYLGYLSAAALVQNSAVANNSATGPTSVGGGLGRFGPAGGGVLFVVSSIVANNTVTAGGTGFDVSGPLTASFSLIREPTGATITDGGNNLPAATNPLFDPAGLTNNGGPTQTIALQAGSPAINAGSNPSGLQFDQRGTGFPRSVGQTDIGAYEFLPPGTPTGTALLSNLTTAGPTYTFSITFMDDTAINVSTLGNGDVRVTGPAGYNQLATFESVDFNTNGTPRTATYSVPGPGGTFDGGDNGTYQVSIEPSAVADTSGNFVPAGTLASFQVLIATTFTVTAIGDTGTGTLRDAIAQANAFSTADTIVFGPLFNTAQIINLTSDELLITSPVTITGPGANLLTVRRDAAAATQFRVFELNAPGIVNFAISGMTISGGSTTGGGGGGAPVGDGAGLLMFNDIVTLDGLIITGNTASAEGGGITVASVNSAGAGTLTVRNSTVSGNTANGNVGNYSGGGGGIYLANGGSLRLENSTVSGNTSTFGRGGGVYFYGTINANGFTIINSTITGNSASRNGGGVYLGTITGTAQIRNSTITGNTTVVGGGGVSVGGTTGLVTIESSVISDNTGLANDISGPATVSFSLIRDPSGGTITDAGNNLATGTDPMFVAGGLANNGGPTQTIALQGGSPLLNVGSNPENVTTDQRGPGFARPSGTGVDIGAFELQVATAPTVTSAVVNGSTSQQRSRVTSVNVTFSAVVTFATTPGAAFTLTRNGGGAVTFTATANTVGGVTVVTLNNFSGAETEFGSLRDGNYTLTALANQISAGGLQMAANFVFGDQTTENFYRFYGDVANLDRRIDISDFGFFSLAYLTPANYNSALDFNQDSRIDIADFGQFSVRYFTSLP